MVSIQKVTLRPAWLVPSQNCCRPTVMFPDQETGSIDVHLTDWEDLATAIGYNIGPDLQKIADAINQLER